MPNMTTSNAKDWTVTVGDVFITGWGADMVKYSKDEDYHTTNVGAQGDVHRDVTNNPLGTIELTVHDTCPQMGYLAGLAKSQEFVPIWLANKVLGRRIGGSQASVRTLPEGTVGAEASDRTFVFTVFDYDEIYD